MSDNEKRIVVIAMDGSPYSDYAFDWYVENAKKANDEVIIATCLDNHGCTAYMSKHLTSDEIKNQLQQDIDMHAALEGHLQLKMTNSGVKGSIFSCFGKPGEAIVHAARDKNASIIICGSRGHGTIRRTLMGSVSSYVVHHSHIPTIVCRHKDHHQHHYHDHNQPHNVVTESSKDEKILLSEH